MGAWQSTQRGTEEVEDVTSSPQYRYPPKSGNFFSSHFIMGGEKFDSPQPESFLFGENSDLNFLGCKPIPFPYPPPQANEPTKTLKALINIRRDSLHFTKVKNADGVDEVGKYEIEFTFDSDVKTSITIHYLATEDMTGQAVVYTPKTESLSTSTYMYRRGAGQVFSQPEHIFQPSLHEGQGLDCTQGDILPIVVHCLAEEGEEPRQSHVTIGVIEKHSDGSYALKTLKQKLFVDGLCYLIQEIYGVERKGADEVMDDEIDDTGAECVVCMCDPRDTLILPCRHLCLCNACADSLRYQANNCPICRAPFRALLQVRALQKTGHSATHPALAAEAPTEGVPPGYEIVSLVEALNGPLAPPPPPPLALGSDEGKKKKPKRRGSKEQSAANKLKQSGGSEKSMCPPPVEELDSLPPPPSPPHTVAAAAAGDVTIVDEKSRRASIKSLRKSKNLETLVLPDENNKIKLEVLSQVSLKTVGTDDIVDQELARIEGGKAGYEDDADGEEADQEVKEPTTEDELLNEDSQPTTGVIYVPDYSSRQHDDDDDDEDDVIDIEDDDLEEDDDDDDVEVVSLRSLKNEIASIPGTPRSSTSVRSSQESGSSVNSSKQLLENEQTEEKCASSEENLIDKDRKKDSEDRKKRRGKSSIAPQPEMAQ